MTDRILALVLDHSDSMRKVWSDASEAFLGFVEEWTEKDPDLPVVLTTFNHEVSVGDPTPISEVELSVSPHGYTALYDATMMTLSKLDSVVEDGQKVVVAIITDGMENESREHTNLDEVNRTISKKQEDGWTILYLGTSNEEWARRDLYDAGLGMGVDKGSTFTFEQTKVGYRAAYGATTSALVSDEEDTGDSN